MFVEGMFVRCLTKRWVHFVTDT